MCSKVLILINLVVKHIAAPPSCVLRNYHVVKYNDYYPIKMLVDLSSERPCGGDQSDCLSA